MGVIDTIKQATRARRSVELVLDTALEEEWLSLQSKLVDAAEDDAKKGSLARPATTDVVDRMEEIRDKVAASSVTFVFEQVGWAERISLQTDNPPRDGNRLDQVSGYNIETFTPSIIRRACVGAYTDGESEPTPLTDEVWDDLLTKLSYGQIDRLFSAAVITSDGVTKVPTSARFLLETQDSGASLAQPGPGPDQARSGGAGGNRRTSRRSTTTKKVTSNAS